MTMNTIELEGYTAIIRFTERQTCSVRLRYFLRP